MKTTSGISVQWFWRVVIWLLIDVDIPQLSSSGIYFNYGYRCFSYTYSLQSSSTHSPISSSFDATALAAYIVNRSQYIPFDLSKLMGFSTDLTIPNECFNTNVVTSFLLSTIGDLKSIVIGDECFGKVRVFELDGLSELENVVIGQRSFRISSSERDDGVCRIVNCPKLKSITVDRDSFDDYNILELNSLPSLHSIDVKYGSYYRIRSFSLTGLIDWLV